MKSGTRLLLNTSPEPISNWMASGTEDTAVVGGLALAFIHPWLALGLVIGITGTFTAVVVLLWRAVFRRKPRAMPG
jgi:hypothetical protein